VRAWWLVALAIGGCKDAPPSGAPALKPEWLTAPADEPVATIMLREADRAAGEGRKVLLYVGASWCEPCQLFHEAVAAGKLDAELGGLRFVAFDLDHDRRRLAMAGCSSDMIPLFARPTAEGRCDATARVAGAMKGDGAVPYLVGKIRELGR
jgi:thiol-disulfide isomerase/thioredoxin